MAHGEGFAVPKPPSPGLAPPHQSRGLGTGLMPYFGHRFNAIFLTGMIKPTRLGGSGGTRLQGCGFSPGLSFFSLPREFLEFFCCVLEKGKE